MRDALNMSTAVWLQSYQCRKITATIALSEHGACCIFGTKSARKPRVCAEHSKPRSYYNCLRDVHHQMWRIKVLLRLERTQTPGRENSKSLGVAMTSDSRGRARPENRRRDKHARNARGYTCILSREPRPVSRGGYCEKSLTKASTEVTHCVILLPLGGSSRRNKGDESIGQLSAYIG